VASLALAPEVTATRPPFPYPGLRPFEPDEWLIFFGREAMIDELIDRLAQHRFVLIHGASGSGKSSLVRAGVLPKLARQHLRHGAPWLTCAMRPSGGPLWNLAAEFARLEGRGQDIARITDIIRQLNRRGATLSQVVGSLDGLAGKRLCLLVDQFEEIFRFERETSREETELFIELLIGEISQEQEGSEQIDPASALASVERTTNLHIVITMRSEFLGECARFDHFAEAINRVQYLVPRLTPAGLMRAIRQPAQLYGGEVTAELAERLIADVRGKLDELPLIQHGLMLFWHQCTETQTNGKIILDAAMLDNVGNLAQLLSGHADRVMQAASPSELLRFAVARLFRSLTDINADGQAIRRPQSFRDLVAVCGIPEDALRGILDAFRAEGVSFITPYAPAAITEATIIDISHESLIRSWHAIADPQNGWLRDEFEDGLVWRSLLLEAKEFARNRKRVLSPATATERGKWLAKQTPVWGDRYGGSWGLVDQLLQASRKAAIRGKRYRRLILLPLLLIAILGITVFLDEVLPNSVNPRIWGTPLVGLIFFASSGVIGCLLAVTVVLMVVDYGLGLIRAIRRLLGGNSNSAKGGKGPLSKPLEAI
jgi:energy-coupling factor transporter ATP-binding protein EcfA2